MMFINIGSAQHIGSRSEQQDALGFSDIHKARFIEHGGVLALVADGIGGHPRGGQASKIAVSSFLQQYMAKNPDASIPDALLSAMRAAHGAVLQEAEIHKILHNCGTTLVAAVIHPASDNLFWISAGDSRLYLLRRGELTQLTIDHNHATLRLQKLADGRITRNDEYWNFPVFGLTCCVGMFNTDQEIDRACRPFRLEQDDTLLLCSDGVYVALTRDQLIECLNQPPQQACEQIVRNALMQYYANQDNLTAVVLRYQASPAKAESRKSWLRRLWRG